MDAINLTLIVALLANLFLVSLLWTRAKRDTSSAMYMIMVATVALWTASMIFYRSAPPELTVKAAQMLYISATLIPFFLLYFAVLFPSLTFTLSRLQTILIALLPLSIIGFTLSHNLVIKEVLDSPGEEKKIVFGILYPMYALYISGYFILALWYLLKKYRKSSGILKTQISYILLGLLISIVLGSFFNLSLPSIGDFRFNWLGNVTTLIMVSITTYAIVAKRLFDIRIVLTQSLVGIIAILLFINVILSETPFEYFWKGGLLLAFLIAGYLLIKSVMNEIKQREELQQTYAKLKELDEAKSEFVSIASHQLRTPLTAIKGYISMILEGSYGNLNETQHKPMKSVYESNERLINLVNDLLNISRIESGKIDMKWAQKNIEDVIKSVIEEIGIKAKEKKIKLVFEKSEELIPQVTLDEAKIRNVLLNVVDNAIRYTKKGKITIRAYQKQKESSIVIEVKDTGDGMTQEELSHLFESFSRGGAGTRTSTEGAGLGLYIAKQFMKLHKGQIWAESQGRGEGSTFFIELPMQ